MAMQAHRWRDLPPQAARRKRRRWQIIVSLALLALGIYGASLTWVTRTLATDVARSIHPLPAVVQAERQASRPD